MKGICRPRLAWLDLFAVLLVGPVVAQTRTPVVSLTPAVVVTGSPELIRVREPAAGKLDGEWLGQKLEFFRGVGDTRTPLWTMLLTRAS